MPDRLTPLPPVLVRIDIHRALQFAISRYIVNDAKRAAFAGAEHAVVPAHEKQRNRVVLLLTDAELREARRRAGEKPLGRWLHERLVKLLRRR